jgi:hypothetical protein
MLLAVAFAIMLATAFGYYLIYASRTTYGSVDRLVLNGYFNGKPLPKEMSLPYYDTNVTGEYALAVFQHIIAFNDSLGSFKLGVSFSPNGSLWFRVSRSTCVYFIILCFALIFGVLVYASSSDCYLRCLWYAFRLAVLDECISRVCWR